MIGSEQWVTHVPVSRFEPFVSRLTFRCVAWIHVLCGTNSELDLENLFAKFKKKKSIAMLSDLVDTK